jgi:DNA repair protein RadC
MKICDFPQNEKPRERLAKDGAKALTDAELLALVLRTGSNGENVIELSRRLLGEFGLAKLARINLSRLTKLKGIGSAKASQIVGCFELGRRADANKQIQTRIKSITDAAKLLMPDLSDLKKEHFIGLYLDSRNNLLKQELLFVGCLTATVVHPREVFQPAIAESAAKIIIAHNHPSGDPAPTRNDIELTKNLIAAGRMLGIELAEHIIIGNNKFSALIQQGFV